MRLLDVINSILGFVWQQPLHVTLRQMRLMQVGLIVNSQWLLWIIVGKIERLDPVQATMALGAIATALIAQIWVSVTSLSKHTERD